MDPIDLTSTIQDPMDLRNSGLNDLQHSNFNGVQVIWIQLKLQQPEIQWFLVIRIQLTLVIRDQKVLKKSGFRGLKQAGIQMSSAIRNNWSSAIREPMVFSNL